MYLWKVKIGDLVRHKNARKDHISIVESSQFLYHVDIKSLKTGHIRSANLKDLIKIPTIEYLKYKKKNNGK